MCIGNVLINDALNISKGLCRDGTYIDKKQYKGSHLNYRFTGYYTEDGSVEVEQIHVHSQSHFKTM